MNVLPPPSSLLSPLQHKIEIHHWLSIVHMIKRQSDTWLRITGKRWKVLSAGWVSASEDIIADLLLLQRFQAPRPHWEW